MQRYKLRQGKLRLDDSGDWVRRAEVERLTAEVKALRNDWPYDHMPQTEAGGIILPRLTFCNYDGDSLVVSAIRYDHDGWTITSDRGDEYSPGELFEAAEAAKGAGDAD